ncbi:MAG: hypothetical protein FJX42_04300 [Alphaproteobacteria bacterium]|nr:hypothetical protein [Alphaproteobacteria bacterium]
MTKTPTDDPLRYDLWIEDAFRSVVRRALTHTQNHGLPGDHHFYITFRTGAPGVRMPGYLKAMHPDEMTIVLQFKFEELSVGDDGFSVTLSFKGKRENLHVPLAAVTAFADPSVNFGLQFKITAQGEVHADAGGDKPPAPPAAEETPPAAKAPPAGPGQVIALDSFRKK